ncbi:MAG: YlmC/YmxH family sporulation protein [Candidatus Carbobacillus altaicus]|nr:YlmC/YmxH family sporulation protein [Candidatus Carbobacillus altaicus]
MIKVSEFQSKDVVDMADGKRLGRVGDLELDLEKGRIRALVIPSGGRLFGLFSNGQDIVIPWENIVKIGLDVILVRRTSESRKKTELPYDLDELEAYFTEKHRSKKDKEAVENHHEG